MKQQPINKNNFIEVAEVYVYVTIKVSDMITSSVTEDLE